MKSRKDFCVGLAELELSPIERAVAVIWFYRQSQEFEERSASDLASDLQDEGFPKPNVTRLKEGLKKSKYVVNGKRKGTFQLDVRRIKELDDSYSGMLGMRRVKITGAVLPTEIVAGTRVYLEKMVYQINGAYESGFYDASAVICRRLMESLIIEVYISQNRQHEIQNNGVFLYLDALIKYISNDKTVILSRNTPKSMLEIKQVGDTAAHDRVYITRKEDIDDLKAKYRRLISDLLSASGIKK
jgi:hypothetical protein